MLKCVVALSHARLHGSWAAFRSAGPATGVIAKFPSPPLQAEKPHVLSSSAVLPRALSCKASLPGDGGTVAQQGSNGTGEPQGTFAIRPPATEANELQRAKRGDRTCRRCKGTGKVACKDCAGSGRLGRGGYHTRNQVHLAKIIDSNKWTAMDRTFGYNYFTATQKRKEGKDNYVLMAAAGDTSRQFWVNVKNLKDRERWACGWLGKAQLSNLQSGPECRTCAGLGTADCPVCQVKPGEVVDI